MDTAVTTIRTHAQEIAQYRRWFRLAANSAHVVYAALASLWIYVAIFVGDTSSPSRRLVGALFLLGTTAVCWYFVGHRRKSTSCIAVAALCALVGLRIFGDGSLMDYMFTGLSIYHLLLFVPVLMLDPDFEKFADAEMAKEASESVGSGDRT